MHRIFVLRLVAFLVCLSVASTALAASYLATFDGTPAVPLPFVLTQSYMDFDVQVHSRDSANSAMGTLAAEHGADCGAPPATHLTSGDVRDSVFQCNGHVMTALNEEGYGAIYLTPNHMVDFGQGGTVSFELSTEKLSTRDWWDITVSPFADTQALPLLSDLSQGVDLQSPNRNSVVVTTDNGQAAPNLKVVTNGNVTSYGSLAQTPFNAGVVAGTNQAKTRQVFKLTLSPTHVRFERLASTSAGALVFLDQNIATLNWTQGVVQFGHHSYNPTKDGAGSPATWHWDNFAIDPALPFTIIHFTDRATTGGTIVATTPAPANAYLHFSAICLPVVNGVTPPKMTDIGHPEHFSSYMLPIAQGAQTFSVSFKTDASYGAPCLMKDYTIWSPGSFPVAPPTGGPPPSPSPSPIPTPPPPPPGGSGGLGSPPAAVVPAPPSSFSSAWLSQTGYPTLRPSDVADVTIRFRNTGETSWNRGVELQEARLGIVNDDRSFAARGMDVNWVLPDRPAVQDEAVVPPGGIATFRFGLRAPIDPGVYRLPLQPVIDGLTWLNDEGVFLLVTSDWGYHSQWIAQSPYPTLQAGQESGDLSVMFQNVGTATWVQGGPTQVNLGIAGDDSSWAPYSIAWISANRLATTREPQVAPGQLGSFVFRLRAPPTPGQYVIRVRPVVDGATWLEDDGVWLAITVIE